MQHLHPLTDPQFLSWLSYKCVTMRYMYKITFTKIGQILHDLCLFMWCVHNALGMFSISRDSRVCIKHMRKLFQIRVWLILSAVLSYLSVYIHFQELYPVKPKKKWNSHGKVVKIENEKSVLFQKGLGPVFVSKRG